MGDAKYTSVLVNCRKCGTEFPIFWGKRMCACPKCGPLNIKDVRLVPGELPKIFR